MGSGNTKDASPSNESNGLLSQQVILSENHSPIPVDSIHSVTINVGIYIIILLLLLQLLFVMFKEYKKSLKKRYLGRSMANLGSRV